MSYTQAQLVAAWIAASDGVAPDAATTSVLGAFANQTQTGQLSDANALAYVINGGGNTSTIGFQATTAVAWESYEFFTGKSPTKAGLDYLVSPTGPNANNLNSAYYSAFSLENRYINFAGNLGLVGDGAAAFAATYGAMAFGQAVSVLYESIIGTSYAQAAGINVTAAIADITSRQANFIQIAKDRGLITATSTAAQQDLAVKAELAGYLMVEGIKADVGIYAAGANNFAQALIAGNPVYNTDLLTYANLGGGTGSAVGGTGPTAGGTSQSFTPAIDALVGTAGNDIFTGDNSVAGGQVSASDSVDGKGGSDTFRYFSPTAGVLPQMTSIENINFVNTAIAGVAMNVSGVVGLQFVSIENPLGAGDSIAVAAGVTVGLTNNTGGFAEQFKGTGTQTSMSAVLTGNLNDGGGVNLGAGTLDLAGAAISTVNISSVGPVKNTLAGLMNSAGVLTTLNVTGGAALGITAPLAATITTVDASANTGGLTVILGTGGAADMSLKGGSGADSFNVTAVTGKITAALGDGNDTLTLNNLAPGPTSSFDGGNGTDTIALSLAGPGAFANFNAGNLHDFTNFEAVRLSGAAGTVLGDTATFDASAVPTGVTSFQVGFSAGGITLNNLAAAPVVTAIGNVAGTSGLVLNLKDATGTSDSVTVVLAGNVPALGGSRVESVLSAPGVETININSIVAAGQGPNIITKLGVAANDTTLSNVNITGSGALTLTTDALTHSATINGSAATGSLIINAFAVGAPGIGYNINGGSANDTIIAGQGALLAGIAPNQLLNGGGGGDLISLNGALVAGGPAHVQVDSLIFKAGTDSLLDLVGTVGASGGAIPNTGTMDSVVGFTTNQDTIDLTSFGLTNAQAVIADKGTVASTGAMVALAAGATFFQDAATVQRGVAEVHVGADTYLFVDVNHNNTFDAASDLVVKFVGTAAIANNDILH
jgi:S-layer protein